MTTGNFDTSTTNERETDMTTKHGPELNRRGLLLAAGGLAAVATVDVASAQTATQPAASTTAIGRRKLGTLEVSSVGLGVQNMSRTYQQTIPTRAEMHNIIRAAYDNGLTFFDAAEAYGPHEVERILGEGVEPFRDQIVIATKFGWNIDLETGAQAGAQQPPGTYQTGGRRHAQASSYRSD